MKRNLFWIGGLIVFGLILQFAIAVRANESMTVSEFVAREKSLIKNPLLAARVFEFDESSLLEAMNEHTAMDEIRRELSNGQTATAMSAAVQLIDRHPLCYSAWTMLAVGTLQKAETSGGGFLAGESLPLQKLLALIVAGSRGDSKTVAALKVSLLREHRDWWPMYKVLPMLPESSIDFRDKAEFNRRCLKEASNWKWKSTSEMLAVNGIISALEAEGGCRRVCEESNLNEKGAELLCPLGVTIVLETEKPRCPVHGYAED